MRAPCPRDALVCRCTLFTVINIGDALMPNLEGKFRHFEAYITMELLDFDRDVESSFPMAEVGVRQMLIQARICRSIMDVPQKNINFGSVDIKDTRSKVLAVNNVSQVPLLYRVRKSGNIASGDLLIQSGRMGIVRPYGTKEVRSPRHGPRPVAQRRAVERALHCVSAGPLLVPTYAGGGVL
jgi:hypothetical protein